MLFKYIYPVDNITYYNEQRRNGKEELNTRTHILKEIKVQQRTYIRDIIKIQNMIRRAV